MQAAVRKHQLTGKVEKSNGTSVRKQDLHRALQDAGIYEKVISTQIQSSGGAVANTVERGTDTDPNIGRQVRQKFDGEWFHGRVVGKEADKEGRMLYTVEYEDGDIEDYYLSELNALQDAPEAEQEYDMRS